MSKVFVGNLPHDATEGDLSEKLNQYGHVESVSIVHDRRGRSRCFGFAEIKDAEEAIPKMQEVAMGDRALRIQRAHGQGGEGRGGEGRGGRGGGRRFGPRNR
jgi:RNA recognition motif-containing protein